MTNQNWFEKLVGFSESDGYAAVQSRLGVEGEELVSTVNGKRYGIGELTLPTLAELRSRVNPARGQRSSARIVVADVQKLHSEPEYEGALFQVASQFNLLEMVSERVTPRAGRDRLHLRQHPRAGVCDGGCRGHHLPQLLCSGGRSRRADP